MSWSDERQECPDCLGMGQVWFDDVEAYGPCPVCQGWGYLELD